MTNDEECPHKVKSWRHNDAQFGTECVCTECGKQLTFIADEVAIRYDIKRRQ
jgi:hypothetical protein